MPVTQLKNVVLPDPLGPISALTLPWWKVTLAPSTACTPPKDFFRSTVARLGVAGAVAAGPVLPLVRVIGGLRS